MLKYFPLSPNTQKELRIQCKKFSLLTMPGDFKGTVFGKKSHWGKILAMMNSLQIIFFGYL